MLEPTRVTCLCERGSYDDDCVRRTYVQLEELEVKLKEERDAMLNKREEQKNAFVGLQKR